MTLQLYSHQRSPSLSLSLSLSSSLYLRIALARSLRPLSRVVLGRDARTPVYRHQRVCAGLRYLNTSRAIVPARCDSAE